MRHTRQSGANLLNKTGVPSTKLIDYARAEGVVPGKLTVGVNVVGWVGETAGTGWVARPEGIAVAQPVVLDEQAVIASGLIINSARCLFPLEQVADGLRLLPIEGNAVAEVRAAER